MLSAKLRRTFLRGDGRPLQSFIFRGQGLEILSQFGGDGFLSGSALIDHQSPNLPERFQRLRRVACGLGCRFDLGFEPDKRRH